MPYTRNGPAVSDTACWIAAAYDLLFVDSSGNPPTIGGTVKLTFWILAIIASATVAGVQGFAWADERWEHKVVAQARETAAVQRADVYAKKVAAQVNISELSSSIEILKLRQSTLEDRVFDISAKVQVNGASKMPKSEIESWERYKSELNSIREEIAVKQRTLIVLRGLQ